MADALDVALAACDAFLDSHRDELIAFRRRIHSHPELSGEEYETTQSVIARLSVAGLVPEVLPTGTGVVCDIPFGPPADSAGSDTPRLVAVRADLDALAMDDESLSPYRSQVEGVSHACGHDVHATVLLGVGLLLARLFGPSGPHSSPGSPLNALRGGAVRLIFEPAEELVPGGAVDVIKAGYLDGVGAIFGLHCDPKVNVGHVGVKPGPITSASDMIEILLTGPGGHTARPERTVNLVDVAAHVAAELPALMAEGARSAGVGHVRTVFGALRAGDAANVIPSHARLRGTMRTQDRAAWDAAPGLLTGALEDIVGPTGATWSLAHMRGIPPVVNELESTRVFRDAAVRALGEAAVVQTAQSWGGDSFAWYLEHVAGSYARLGVHNPAERDVHLDLHASTFDVDERAIDVGVRLLVATVVKWLAGS